jgi:hypothetical protein
MRSILFLSGDVDFRKILDRHLPLHRGVVRFFRLSNTSEVPFFQNIGIYIVTLTKRYATLAADVIKLPKRTP